MSKFNKTINILHEINKITWAISLILLIEWLIAKCSGINAVSLLNYTYWGFTIISILTGLSVIIMLRIQRKRMIKSISDDYKIDYTISISIEPKGSNHE